MEPGMTANRTARRDGGSPAFMLPFSTDPNTLHDYYAHHTGHTVYDPEIDIRVAMLQQAEADWRLAEEHKRQGGKVAREAQELADSVLRWLDGPSRGWEYSFRHICEALGVEPWLAKRFILTAGTRQRRMHVVRKESVNG